MEISEQLYFSYHFKRLTCQDLPVWAVVRFVLPLHGVKQSRPSAQSSHVGNYRVKSSVSPKYVLYIRLLHKPKYIKNYQNHMCSKYKTIKVISKGKAERTSRGIQ